MEEKNKCECGAHGERCDCVSGCGTGSWLRGWCGTGMWGGKRSIKKALAAFLVILCVFFAIKTINEIKSGELIGTDKPAVNMITVSGKGEVLAVPDIATFDFTVTENAKTVSDAQKMATDKTNKAIAYLKSQGVADKDIKTTSYNIYPKYEFMNSICTRDGLCPQGKQILTGYEVSQSIEVKVRNIDKAGVLLAGVGELGVENVNGLTLAVDKQDELLKDARTKAIADARADADRIAKDLGVKIVRVTSFTEENGGVIMPLMYKSADMGMGGETAPAPQIPAGENKITSNVTVTYEIR